jgi:diadenosine tetraphosphate (Ap4A) HIT family hydrolase
LFDNPAVREWPADWEERKRGKDCAMCGDGRPDESAYGIRIRRAAYSDAYLQKHGLVRGYTIVIWRGRHVAEPTELTPDEANAYWREVLDVAGALERNYAPLKINLEMLGNTLPHLHTHVRPRYKDDPSPFGPLPHRLDNPAFPEAQLREDAAALQSLLAT